jgi:hypothetical protein
LKKIGEIMWIYRPMDYKYRAIFKLKRNEKKLIDGLNVKIEENLI